MRTVQFISITPEELKSEILEGVKSQIADLRKDYQPKKPNEYLTRYEVAEMFSVDISTVHNWTKKGKLKSYGIGARVYYKRVEVEEALISL